MSNPTPRAGDMIRHRSALLLALLLAGCGSWKMPTSLNGDLPAKGSIIPSTVLKLTSSLAVPLDKIVYWGIYAGSAYLILDPLAPNWEIEEAGFPDDHYRLSLNMRRYYAGGMGEARLVFHRRAKELAQLGGYDGYEVLEYSEGIESSVLGSRRNAVGVIALTRKNG